VARTREELAQAYPYAFSLDGTVKRRDVQRFVEMGNSEFTALYDAARDELARLAQMGSVPDLRFAHDSGGTLGDRSIYLGRYVNSLRDAVEYLEAIREWRQAEA